jgi:hypothetical protein
MFDDIERLMHEVKGVCDGIATICARRLPASSPVWSGCVAVRCLRTTNPAAVHDAVEETKVILGTSGAMLRISEVEDGMRRADSRRSTLPRWWSTWRKFYDPLAEEKGLSLYRHNGNQPVYAPEPGTKTGGFNYR